MSIADYVINRSDIDSRISELEEDEDSAYDVVRVRNDEVLESFDNTEDAEAYIESEDYNRERVVVRQRGGLDEDDARELEQLRELLGDIGVSGDFTLYRDDYFDTDWVQEQAADALGVSRSRLDFDAWPLNQIDWDEATGEQRDVLYEYSYRFDGDTYYSAE